MKINLLILLTVLITSIKAEIIIVTNKNSDINRLSHEAVKYLYLSKVNKIDNIIIMPLLSKDDSLHKRFVKEILDKNIQQYSSYWARLVFTGRAAIPRKLSKKQIKLRLNEKNTIIYIDKKNMNKNWKIIYEE